MQSKKVTTINDQRVLSTSSLSGLLGMNVSASLLKSLGAEPAMTSIGSPGIWWYTDDIPKICKLLSGHLLDVAVAATKERSWD